MRSRARGRTSSAHARASASSLSSTSPLSRLHVIRGGLWTPVIRVSRLCLLSARSIACMSACFGLRRAVDRDQDAPPNAPSARSTSRPTCRRITDLAGSEVLRNRPPGQATGGARTGPASAPEPRSARRARVADRRRGGGAARPPRPGGRGLRGHLDALSDEQLEALSAATDALTHLIAALRG